MKLRNKLLLLAAFALVALPLVFAGNATAAVFNYDGAVHNGTTGLWDMPTDNGTCIGADENTPTDGAAASLPKPTGTGEKCSNIAPDWVRDDFTTNALCTNKGYEWTTRSGGYCRNAWTDDTSAAWDDGAHAAGTGHQCLYCHDGGHATMRGGYLKGGHKNMSRKADGLPWAGSIENGSAIYPGYNWNDPGVTGNGTPYNSTQTSDGKAVFWIYDGWIGTAARNATPGSSYSCGRCHTTGWSADPVAQDFTKKEPYLSFGGNIFSDVNLSAADDSGTMQTYSAWDHFGILCSRCHNAVDGGHANSGDASADMEFGDPAGYASQNAICFNCHTQVNSNNLPLDAATRKIGEELWIANSHGALGIKSHANGFLNSPHSRFSGTWGQLKDESLYDSHFFDNDGACAGCHNLHDSVTDDAPDGEAFNNECGVTCHAPPSPYQKLLANIKHPAGPGTPLGDYTQDEAQEACHVCHMPGGLHLFRISTNPAYTTFPAANMNVPTIPNGDGFPEAYVDIDLACGQCHGGGTSYTPTVNGAPYYTKAYLAEWAEGMHDASANTNNQYPTPAADVVMNGDVASFTDYSTDPVTNTPSGFDTGAIAIDWDDASGTDSPIDNNASIIHTYAATGCYKIKQTATNKAGLSSSMYYNVCVAAGTATVNVDFDGDFTSNGYLYLKRVTGITDRFDKTKTGASWTNVAPGNYKVVAYKSGVAFTCTGTGISGVSSGPGVPAFTNVFAVTSGATIDITCTHTP